MTQNDYEVVKFLHDARINLWNVELRLKKPMTSVTQARQHVERILDTRRFYVSVMTDEAWIGSDGMYVDYGTFDGRVDGGERLSHFFWPLPEKVKDFLAVLADIAEALPYPPEDD